MPRFPDRAVQKPKTLPRQQKISKQIISPIDEHSSRYGLKVSEAKRHRGKREETNSSKLYYTRTEASLKTSQTGARYEMFLKEI